jgi:hypothetical protein
MSVLMGGGEDPWWRVIACISTFLPCRLVGLRKAEETCKRGVTETIVRSRQWTGRRTWLPSENRVYDLKKAQRTS